MADSMVVLKARYTPTEGSNPEYAQGAIEKNDLPHREIAHFVWLIQVEEPGDPKTWSANLNSVVDPANGAFVVEAATPEEEDDVRSGKITMQR